MTTSRNGRRLVALATVNLLVVSLLGAVLTIGPSLLPGAPFTVQANGAGCLDENGHEVTCPISLQPDPLPVGKTIGEQELTGAFGDSSGARVQPYEWTMG